MIISKAFFSTSSPSVNQRPKVAKPEFAFVGRSNVGKSSLINMLCRQKNLAHTSAKPGKTQLINYFIINDEWYLVDLPGYGYAKASKTTVDRLDKMIRDYVNLSPDLVNLFVLIDSRLPLQQIDLQFMLRLGESGIPFSIIYTKSDKSGPNVLKNNIENIEKSLLEYWEELPPRFITSSEKGIGRDEVLDYIENILKTV
ncbi:MAG: YihA family ribosome biogenesis GTP-binding protein [Bacteroidales bacterium]|nr:YihA family ribosome biogenesis GTP-binding protein [Bacteroidales bacterium]